MKCSLVKPLWSAINNACCGNNLIARWYSFSFPSFWYWRFQSSPTSWSFTLGCILDKSSHGHRCLPFLLRLLAFIGVAHTIQYFHRSSVFTEFRYLTLSRFYRWKTQKKVLCNDTPAETWSTAAHPPGRVTAYSISLFTNTIHKPNSHHLCTRIIMVAV